MPPSTLNRASALPLISMLLPQPALTSVVLQTFTKLAIPRFLSTRRKSSAYPPSQKATGVNPWMHARWVPSVALAPGLRSRSICFGGVGKEGALRPSPAHVGFGRPRAGGCGGGGERYGVVGGGRRGGGAAAFAAEGGAGAEEVGGFRPTKRVERC